MNRRPKEKISNKISRPYKKRKEENLFGDCPNKKMKLDDSLEDIDEDLKPQYIKSSITNWSRQ